MTAQVLKSPQFLRMVRRLHLEMRMEYRKSLMPEDLVRETLKLSLKSPLMDQAPPSSCLPKMDRQRNRRAREPKSQRPQEHLQSPRSGPRWPGGGKPRRPGVKSLRRSERRS